MTYMIRPTNMPCAAADDEARLQALYDLDILDTPPDESFERITRLAKVVMNTPIVTIALVDRDRLWFKSCFGLGASQVERDISFCSRTIQHQVPLIICDAQQDPDYRENPFVVNDPHIRFYMGVPLRTSEGFNVGTLCIMDHIPREPLPEQLAVMQDLAGLVVEELELRQLAHSDSLTGAMTRRAFMQEGRRALAHSLRTRAPLTCVILDIDHFKSVNDRYGHAAGDLVLKAAVSVCQENLRAMDSFGRIGGEEFAILFPEAAMSDAVGMTDRLRRDIENLVVPIAHGPIRLTASFGVSSRNGRRITIDALLEEADTALYQAKRSGRNCIVAAGSFDRHLAPIVAFDPGP